MGHLPIWDAKLANEGPRRWTIATPIHTGCNQLFWKLCRSRKLKRLLNSGLGRFTRGVPLDGQTCHDTNVCCMILPICRRQQELQWRRPYCFHNMTIIFHYSMTRNKRVSKSNFRKGHVILVAKHHQRPDLFLRIVACSEVALGVTRRHRSHMSYGQYSWLITIKNGASHPMVHRDL